jgi:molecular chaperone IbpB/HSP20 family protein
MTSKVFNFDLGKIMDEAFKFAEDIGAAFDQNTAERVRRAAERCASGPFGVPDCYPGYLYPPANVYLTPEKKLVFEIALAGFEEKDVSIQFRGDSLLFSAKAPAREPDEGLQFFKRRLRMKDIEEQRFYVPADKFDQAGTQASFRSGLLRIVVPPREKAEQGGEIKVAIDSSGGS